MQLQILINIGRINPIIYINLSLPVSLCNFNSLQISVKAKWLNNKKNPWRKIEILVKKKPSLHKNIWLIYRENLYVTGPNFTGSKI